MYLFRGIEKNHVIRSFFVKQFLIAVILIMIPLLVCVFFVASSANQKMQQEIDNQAKEQAYQTYLRLNETSVFLDKFQTILQESEEVEEYLNLGEQSTITEMKVIQELIKMLNVYIYSVRNIETLYIYNMDTDWVFASSFTGSAPMADFMDNEWYRTYTEEARTFFGREVTFGINTRRYVTFISPLKGPNNENLLVAYNLNDNFIGDIVKESNTDLYLIDTNGKVIYPYNTDIDHLPEKVNEGYSSCNNGTYATSVRKVNDGVYAAYSPVFELYMISASREKNLQTTQGTTALIIAFSLIFGLFIAWTLTNRFYGSIVKIIRTLQYPERVKAHEDYDKDDEISYIIKNILSILDNANEVEVELTKSLSRVKESQTVALQSQITPHFLFNTLQLINSVEFEENKKDTKVVKIVSNLSEILRYVLDSTEYFVPLKTELDFLKKYLEIQRLKYCNKFDVYYDIPDEVLDLQMIKFLLQPIVENAIHHGIGPSDKMCKIYISARKAHNKLIVEIANDGLLISECEIERLNTTDWTTVRKSHNFGFGNVNSWIRTIFSNEYGLTAGKKNGYTTMCVELPAVKYKTGENENA